MANRPTYQIDERETPDYSFTLRDSAGIVVPASLIDSATLTVQVVHTGAIVNARSAQNVKNANNVTISEEGRITWSMQPLDAAIADDTKLIEVHRALFRFVWNGTREKPYEVDFEIRNLSKMP
ncbi:MAG: hypothetical protein Q7U76_12915 [Nitrospirota bacterium]|nr:hypothetical protein [Nitrospirota bacterium]